MHFLPSHYRCRLLRHPPQQQPRYDGYKVTQPLWHFFIVMPERFCSLRRCDAAQAEMQMSRDYLAANDCRGSLNALLKQLNSRYAQRREDGVIHKY